MSACKIRLIPGCGSFVRVRATTKRGIAREVFEPEVGIEGCSLPFSWG